jgi:hypothetical protein
MQKKIMTWVRVSDVLDLCQSPDRRIDKQKRGKDRLIRSESRVRRISLAASKRPSGGTALRFSASEYLQPSFRSVVLAVLSTGWTAPSTDSDKAAGCRSNSVQMAILHLSPKLRGGRPSLDAPANPKNKNKSNLFLAQWIDYGPLYIASRGRRVQASCLCCLPKALRSSKLISGHSLAGGRPDKHISQLGTFSLTAPLRCWALSLSRF